MTDVREAEASTDFPSYDELPTLESTGEPYAWKFWGASDQLGTVNRLNRDTVRRARDEIVSGQVVSLSLPLNQPDPGLFEGREAYRRHEIRTNLGREDSITNLDLQFSSQWDGLRHIKHKTAGYYGGRDDDALDRGELGIEVLAGRGIVGRGVFVDVPAYFAAKGLAYDVEERIAFDTGLIQEILAFEQVRIEYGDILVVRTGWIDWYLTLGAERRGELYGAVHTGDGAMASPGLCGNEDMARWLWNSGFAAVASDNAALEALPVNREDGFLHRRLLPLLGMPIGELWALKELSAQCLRSGKYTFLLTSAPLRIPSGVASPANALAIL